MEARYFIKENDVIKGLIVRNGLEYLLYSTIGNPKSAAEIERFEESILAIKPENIENVITTYERSCIVEECSISDFTNPLTH